MNQQEILKKIGVIIAELKDQHGYLQANANDFNELELELFMANASFLTDHIEILKKIYGQAKLNSLFSAKPVLPLEKKPEPPPVTADYFSSNLKLTEKAEPVIIANVPAEAITEVKQEEITEIQKNEIILLPEVMPQPDENINNTPLPYDASFIEQKLELDEENSIVTVIEQIETPSKVFVKTEELPEVQPPTIVFLQEEQPEPIKVSSVKVEVEPVLTLNQRIAAQNGLDQLKIKTADNSNKPVQDLQSIISLNDKLLFVRELFNGYNLAYAEAINILNRYASFEQSEQFLNLNYAVKNSWKEKPETAGRFFDLLRKRFT